LPGVPLKIAGSVSPDLVVRPAPVRFPPAPLGAAVRTTFQISSRSGRSVQIVSAESLSEDATLALLDAAAVGGPLFEVHRTIRRRGPAVDNLRLIISAGGDETAISVPVHATGTASAFAAAAPPGRDQP
ncbi:MAG: hypothetical protein M3552_22200, partial [Planctomycetota bacterium]|nr:hypothetical protein [Planctomycetota bacterium]